jgi:cardiolipin synthase
MAAAAAATAAATAHRPLSTTTPTPGSRPPDQDDDNQNSSNSSSQPSPTVTGSSWLSLPNALSLSRVAAAPVVSWLLLNDSPGPAIALLAAAGFTDFLDGYLARRMGHTSVLGSYLDPLGDKVLAATTAVTLAAVGAAPWWLAGMVAGRDAALVWGVYQARMRAFGGVWPGRRRFFDVDGVVGGEAAGGGGGGGNGDIEQQGASDGGKMPALRPLMISKANTVVQLAFFGGCIGRLWLGDTAVPKEWLDAGEALAAATTAASAWAYLSAWRAGELPSVLGGGGSGAACGGSRGKG